MLVGDRRLPQLRRLSSQLRTSSFFSQLLHRAFCIVFSLLDPSIHFACPHLLWASFPSERIISLRSRFMAAAAGGSMAFSLVAASDLAAAQRAPCFFSSSSSLSTPKSSTQCPWNFNDRTVLSSRSCFLKGRNEGRFIFQKRDQALMNTSNTHRSREFLRVKASAEDNGTPAGSPLVICFGEMLIDFVPTVGGVSLAEAPAFKKAPGGAPANVAVGIARLGGKSAFIGKVGEDEFGYMLADILKKNNVHDEGILFDKGARTALAFVTLRSDGEREFMFFRNPSADMLLEESELNVDLIKKASIFHYGSISLITEPCRSAHLAAMKIAREAGALLSYDPNLRLPLWPSAEAARKGIFSIWNEADIIKISEEEITFLTEGGDPYSDEAARNLMHPDLSLLLVTEGQDGCRYYTRDFSGRVDGMLVDTIDTTGAGDAFVAGILSHLVLDKSLIQDQERLREALRFANACGAITTTERGAIPALPDRHAVLKAFSKVQA